MEFWLLKDPIEKPDYQKGFLKLEHLSFEVKKHMLPKLTEMEWNWIILTPLWFYQKLSSDPSKGEPHEIHGKK